MARPKVIQLSGIVYIKYQDDINNVRIGDTLLFLNDEATNPFAHDYENATKSGYIKARIYDGLVWHHMYIEEFCCNKENKFTKKQRAIDSCLLCKDIIKEYKGTALYQSYRGHYTINEYVPIIEKRAKKWQKMMKIRSKSSPG